MASEALAKRLEHILPDLIRYSQNAYLKVRSLFNTVFFNIGFSTDLFNAKIFALGREFETV